MTGATEPATPHEPLVARPDLAEAAVLHASLTLVCLLMGGMLTAASMAAAASRPSARAVSTPVVVDQAAFEAWAGHLLAMRSSTSR